MGRWICVFLLLPLCLLPVACRRAGDATPSPTSTASSPGRELQPRASERGPSRGAAAAEPSLSQAAAPVPGKTFLWRAGSASAVVYLLGSIHVARADLYPLDPRIEAAFDRSDVLVLEVVLGATERMEAAQKLSRAGTYPNGDRLDRHLAPSLLARVLDHAGDSLGPREGLNHLEPWFVSQLLLMTELQKLGYRDDQGIDRYFQERARGRKRIEALESIDEQVALLDGMPPDLQALMLDETLSELKDLGPTMQRAFDAWKRGDTSALERELMRSMEEPRYATLKKQLFDDRNRRMTEQVVRRLSAGGTWFVVVGSGHLVGDEGIVGQLLRRGIRVEQH